MPSPPGHWDVSRDAVRRGQPLSKVLNSLRQACQTQGRLKQGIQPGSLTCLSWGLYLSLAHTWLPSTPCSDVIDEVLGNTHITFLYFKKTAGKFSFPKKRRYMVELMGVVGERQPLIKPVLDTIAGIINKWEPYCLFILLLSEHFLLCWKARAWKSIPCLTSVKGSCCCF